MTQWGTRVQFFIEPTFLFYATTEDGFAVVMLSFMKENVREFLLTVFGPRVTVVARVYESCVSIIFS